MICVLAYVSWMRPYSGTLGSMVVPLEARYVFEGITGPSHVTTVPKPLPTAWDRYAMGTRSRLAVLLTDPSSAWLGLAHGLKTTGVPFLITQDYAQAITHKVVLVYPRFREGCCPHRFCTRLRHFPAAVGR